MQPPRIKKMLPIADGIVRMSGDLRPASMNPASAWQRVLQFAVILEPLFALPQNCLENLRRFPRLTSSHRRDDRCYGANSSRVGPRFTISARRAFLPRHREKECAFFHGFDIVMYPTVQCHQLPSRKLNGFQVRHVKQYLPE